VYSWNFFFFFANPSGEYLSNIGNPTLATASGKTPHQEKLRVEEKLCVNKEANESADD